MMTPEEALLKINDEGFQKWFVEKYDIPDSELSVEQKGKLESFAIAVTNCFDLESKAFVELPEKLEPYWNEYQEFLKEKK